MAHPTITMVSASLAFAAPSPPTYFACTVPQLPFCNIELPLDSRVKDLVSRLTLDEKINMLSPDPKLGSTCNTHTDGVERLGVPPWMWLDETNSGTDAACYAKDKCSTVFPGPPG